MKIRKRLIVAFIIISLLVGLVGIIGLYANNRIVNSYEIGEEHFGSIIEASNEVSSYAKRAEGHTFLFLTLHNESDRKKLFQRIASLREQIAILEAKVKDPDAIKILNDTKSKTDMLQSITESLIKLYDNEIKTTGEFDFKNHEELIRKLDDVSAAIRQNGLELGRIEIDLQSKHNLQAKQGASFLYNIIFIISGIAIFFALIIGIIIDKNISNPINKLRDMAAKIGKGNLDMKIDIESNDEIGELSNEFNRMIEKLKKSNEEMLSSKEYTDNIVGYMDDSLIVVSPDGIIQKINKTTSTLLDYGEEELIGQPISKVLIDGDKLLPNILKCDIDKKKDCIKSVESKYIKKNLIVIDIIFSASIMCDNNGNVRGIVCVAHDISERKRMENTLRKSKESFSKAEKIGHFGNWEWEIATNKVVWSDEVFRLYGLDPQKVVPTYETVVNTLSDEVKELFNKAIDDALNNNALFDGEYSLIRPDGSVRYTHTTGEVIRDRDGRPLSMFGVVQDITERKEAEKELLKFKLGIERSDEAIFMTNIDGQIIYINPAFEKIYGYRREESLGKRPNILKSGLLPPEAYKSFWDTLLAKKVVNGEFINKAKDGHLINIDGSVNPILNNEGNIIGFLAIQRDITERKQAEKLIQDSLHEKETLLREIHHRVKNNMQIISSLLLLQSENIIDQKYLDIFHDINNRILSMALIHEKLYQSEKLAQINIQEYINDLVSNLMGSYGRKGNAELEIDVDNIPLNINYAVPCGLILNELITNSLKYAFPEYRHGIIKIVFQKRDGNMIHFSVSDNGIGLPGDMDIRNTKSLGLHLIYALAENQLHGEIILNRERGTEFQINFKGE